MDCDRGSPNNEHFRIGLLSDQTTVPRGLAHRCGDRTSRHGRFAALLRGFAYMCLETKQLNLPNRASYDRNRAIYRVGDQRVGQWSKPVSVTVGG